MDGRAAIQQPATPPMSTPARNRPVVTPSPAVASGVLLLAATAVALLWANSPWSVSYGHVWHTPFGLRIAGFDFERSLEWVVNDGLMVIFFFVVGLEIRRELHDGELSTGRQAALPAAAALGGMLVPAGLYLAIAGAPATRSGWGVPMATDIAFALGVLTLLGKRVPAGLRILLLALAVIDDLGAILVIALFYSQGVGLAGLLVAGAGLCAIRVMQGLGVRLKIAYVLPAVVTWAGVYSAGIHPTIAGVAVGLMTPVRAWPGREAVSPAQSLLQRLNPWVAFGIMPVFALANAGVSWSSGALNDTSVDVLTAVMLGLVVGKPLGVLLFSWLSVRLGVAALPKGVTARHLVVLGAVAGVGFTMALFIAQLGFGEPQLLAAAKLGVLCASGVAAVLALLLGRALLDLAGNHGAAVGEREVRVDTEGGGAGVALGVEQVERVDGALDDAQRGGRGV